MSFSPRATTNRSCQYRRAVLQKALALPGPLAAATDVDFAPLDAEALDEPLPYPASPNHIAAVSAAAHLAGRFQVRRSRE